MYSMHHGEIYRLRRWFANSSSGEQAPRPPSCECEVDSTNKFVEPFDICPVWNWKFHTERYRSGHNGADSKSVCAQAHEGSNPSLSAKKREASSLEGASLLFRENINRDSNAVNKTTQWVVLWTVTEDFCETLHKIQSKTLSKNQERIPLCYILKKDCGFYYFVV